MILVMNTIHRCELVVLPKLKGQSEDFALIEEIGDRVSCFPKRVV